VGDFEGDGAEDRVLVYDDAGGVCRARVEVSYGYAARAVDPVAGAAVINVKRVNLGGLADLGIAE
jgi:hypothetical protein